MAEHSERSEREIRPPDGGVEPGVRLNPAGELAIKEEGGGGLCIKQEETEPPHIKEEEMTESEGEEKPEIPRLHPTPRGGIREDGAGPGRVMNSGGVSPSTPLRGHGGPPSAGPQTRQKTPPSASSRPAHAPESRAGDFARTRPLHPTHFWSEEETRFMLNQVKDLNILKFMDGRKTRNAELFKKISWRMAEAGFIRTPEQIRMKWKNLRKSYNVAKLTWDSEGGQERLFNPYFDLMDDMLAPRHLPQAGQDGVDIGFRAADQVESRTGDETTAAMETGEDARTEMVALNEPTGTTQQHKEDSPPGTSESTRSSSPPQRNSVVEEWSEPRPPQPRRRRPGSSDMSLICQEMARNRAFWARLMRESNEHLTGLIAQNNAACNRMLEALLDRLLPGPPTHNPHHSTLQPSHILQQTNSTPQPSTTLRTPTPPHIPQDPNSNP